MHNALPDDGGLDTTLLDDENEDLRKEIVETVGEEWLHTKNAMLNGRAPEELIGTPDELHVRDMLRSFLLGAHS